MAEIGVIPARRGTGLGAALLDRGFRELRRRGAGRIVLDVDAENVTTAIRLYTSAGMTPQPAFTVWEKKTATRYGEAMALRNRVTPFSELVADPARGLVYGNRGCLHNADGEIMRRYGVKRWISCRLEFKGWKRTRLLQPGGSRSSSSSTRQPRSPRATGRARSAGTRTTEAL